jgi:hypothetical protein
VQARWILVPVILGLVVTAPSGAATPKRTAVKPLKAQIVNAWALLPDKKVDPNRCVTVTFAIFPDVPNAVEYHVLVDGRLGSEDRIGGGPPFPFDKYPVTANGQTKVLEAPGNSHWFPVGSTSSGEGCDDWDSADRFKIQEATVTIDLDGKEKPKPPPVVPPRRKLTEPLLGPVLPVGDGTLWLENRGNIATIHPPGGQPETIYKNARVRGPIIVETPANGGMVEINTGSAGSSSSYLIGPGAKVRLEPGKPIELLEWTPGAKWNIPHTPQKIRTDSAVIASRG